jgi:hypothetical protein
MPQQGRTSEVFVEIEREGKPPLRTTFEAYMLAAVEEVPRVRYYVSGEDGERTYLRGRAADMLASAAAYRRVRIATATELAVQS